MIFTISQACDLNFSAMACGGYKTRDRRVRNFSLFFMILVAAFTIYYPYHVLSGLLDYAFLEPRRMEYNRITNGYVTSQMRWMHFTSWFIPLLFGMYACFAALYTSNRFRTGKYFDKKAATGIMHMGVAIIISLATDILATALFPVIHSWANPDGLRAMNIRFRSEETGLILCGIGFCAIGFILKEGIKIDQENKEFV